MTTVANDMLSIHFPNDAFADFYPYDLTLTEGISELYQAKLIVLSEKLYTNDELIKALSLKASLTVTQKLDDGKTTRKRYLNGIVTSVRHTGVFYSTDKSDCFSYILTIEPDLARLQYAKQSKSYLKQSITDVIQTILSQYKISYLFKEEFLSVSHFEKNSLFSQEVHETELCFIKRLLHLYGLSFTFFHQKSAKGSLAQTDLYFSNGTHFPQMTDITYSDGRAVPDTSRFDFRSSNTSNNVWKMNTFFMEQTIGFEGVALEAPYPDGNTTAYDWKEGETAQEKGCLIFKKHFHGYIRDTPNSVIDKDVLMILKAQSHSLELDKSFWFGKSDALMLTPCRLIQIEHFYGNKNNSVIQAMVTRSKLHCRAKWPSTFAVMPDNNGNNQNDVINVEFECMNYTSQTEKRFCSSYKQALKRDINDAID